MVDCGGLCWFVLVCGGWWDYSFVAYCSSHGAVPAVFYSVVGATLGGGGVVLGRCGVQVSLL